MTMDADACYRIFAGRDRRFAGRLFVGVTSTGVYCRPGCPARTPKRQNMRFFACAAAAENDGFRACRRCRPDSVPGSPAWIGTSATVSRALRLIAEGDVEGRSVETLATRLGVGSRHLRRLFTEHLGASPAEVARTRRAHFAKRLIEQTALPLADVAFASGFSSVRQFNDVIRETFAASPREVRRAAPRVQRRDGEFSLVLPIRPPFDWERALSFFASRAIPGVERVSDRSYWRTFEIQGRRGVVAVGPAEAAGLRVVVRVEDPAVLMTVSDRVTALFDLDADPGVIGAHLRKDPLLRPLLARMPGVRLPGAWSPFEIAVRAVLGQQVSVAAARTLAGRVADRFGEPVDGGEDLVRLFPTAERLAEAPLSGIGLTGARAETLRTLARAAADGTVSLAPGANPDVVYEQLVALDGIGPWTAQYVAMRAFHEPDAFPAGDLGVRRALARANVLPAISEVEKRAEAWRPWRAYAAILLWSKGE